MADRPYKTISIMMLLCSFFLSSGVSGNGQEQGHEQIYRAVQTFLEASFSADELDGSRTDEGRHVEVEVSRLDPRLVIPACEIPLETSMNQNQQALGRITVRVECRDNAPWSRYIQATVNIYENVLVAARTLSRGEILDENDLLSEVTEISALRASWLRDPEEVIGQEVRRTIPAGRPVSKDNLTSPELVKRGDTVVITARKGQIVIRHQGTALEAGELGKQISIRNSSSGRTVQARVTGYGETEALF